MAGMRRREEEIARIAVASHESWWHIIRCRFRLRCSSRWINMQAKDVSINGGTMAVGHAIICRGFSEMANLLPIFASQGLEKIKAHGSGRLVGDSCTFVCHQQPAVFATHVTTKLIQSEIGTESRDI